MMVLVGEALVAVQLFDRKETPGEANVQLVQGIEMVDEDGVLHFDEVVHLIRAIAEQGGFCLQELAGDGNLFSEKNEPI